MHVKVFGRQIGVRRHFLGHNRNGSIVQACALGAVKTHLQQSEPSLTNTTFTDSVTVARFTARLAANAALA
jgi:hypothetical protein